MIPKFLKDILTFDAEHYERRQSCLRDICVYQATEISRLRRENDLLKAENQLHRENMAKLTAQVENMASMRAKVNAMLGRGTK